MGDITPFPNNVLCMFNDLLYMLFSVDQVHLCSLRLYLSTQLMKCREVIVSVITLKRYHTHARLQLSPF